MCYEPERDPGDMVFGLVIVVGIAVAVFVVAYRWFL
jgi:hypothetical protein